MRFVNDGIYWENSSSYDMKINHCDVSYNGRYGINASDPSAYFKVLDTGFTNNINYDIYSHSVSETIIDGCSSENDAVSGGGFASFGYYSKVLNNYIRNAGGAGTTGAIYGYNDCDIIGNTINGTKTGKRGINVEHSNNSRIEKNTLVSTGAESIVTASNAHYTKVIDNAFITLVGTDVLYIQGNYNEISLNAIGGYRMWISGDSCKIFDNIGMGTIVGSGTNKKIYRNLGYNTESSGSSTGTGSEQTIAHGLAAIPTGCKAWIKYLVNGRYITEMIPFDTTYVYPTVTSGLAYEWRIE
jgi:hypothetical protein